MLYAPGLRERREVRAVCEAVSQPVNVLASPRADVRRDRRGGAQRVSVGGALTWVGRRRGRRGGERMRDQGDLSWLTGSARVKEWLGDAR